MLALEPETFPEPPVLATSSVSLWTEYILSHCYLLFDGQQFFENLCPPI